jgi:hypothetical protein
VSSTTRMVARLSCMLSLNIDFSLLWIFNNFYLLYTNSVYNELRVYAVCSVSGTTA